MSVFESADVEVKVRRVLREAVEAMFPTRLFHVDATPIDSLPEACAFVEGSFVAGAGCVPAKTKAYVVALPCLPCMVAGKTAAEACSNTLQWLSHRVRAYGPPRLGSEAERWADELDSLGIPVIDASEMNLWDDNAGRDAWIEDAKPLEDLVAQGPDAALKPVDPFRADNR